jgi:hypothetical protein
MIASAGAIPTESNGQASVGNCDTNPRVTLEDLGLDLLLELTLSDD